MPLIEDRSRPSSMAVAGRCTTAPIAAIPAIGGTGQSGRHVSGLTSVEVRWCWCHDPFRESTAGRPRWIGSRCRTRGASARLSRRKVRVRWMPSISPSQPSASACLRRRIRSAVSSRC